MPDILVKPTRYLSPVDARKRKLRIRDIFFGSFHGIYRKEQKSVRFAGRTEVHTIESHKKYTKKEKDSYWYMKSEYRRMKLTKNLAERMLGRGKPLPEDEEVAVGLETSTDARLRALCSIESVRSVLIEQEIQKWETEGDPQLAIAEVYFDSSFASRLDALERALALESQLTPERWLSEHHDMLLYSSSDDLHNASSSSLDDTPVMPIREESVRSTPRGDYGLGLAPVRMESLSDCGSEDGYDDDELDVSFHNEPCMSTSLPRMPVRQSSLVHVH